MTANCKARVGRNPDTGETIQIIVGCAHLLSSIRASKKGFNDSLMEQVFHFHSLWNDAFFDQRFKNGIEPFP